jgi:hypothetical protein
MAEAAPLGEGTSALAWKSSPTRVQCIFERRKIRKADQ